MTVKPGLQGSLAAMAVAVAAGLVPSLSPAVGPSPMKEQRA
jgi:hypothetical protein